MLLRICSCWALLSHHSVFLTDKSTEENGKLNCYGPKKCSFQREIWSTRGGVCVWRRQKEQNSIKGETRAIGTYVFCQISALVPIEVNCEICIYFTDLSEAAYTWQCSPKQLHIALPGPLEAHKTTRPYATALEKRSLARTLPSTSGLFNVIFKRFSLSLRSKGGGGSVWLYLWPWQLFTSRDSWVTNI